MFSKHYKLAFISTAAFFAVSCAGGPFNGPQHAATVAQTHPISVDSQVVTLTIDSDPSMTDVSAMDKARLRSFADAYMNNGHGPLTITAPSGGGADFDGQEAASDIRKALHDAGIPWSALAGATYRTGGSPEGDQLILSFTRYVATPSQCGVWSGMRARDYRNLRSPNMGCAVMNNVAAMIGDPHELVEPADLAPRDGEMASRAVERYRAGEITASEIDTSINPQVSN